MKRLILSGVVLAIALLFWFVFPQSEPLIPVNKKPVVEEVKKDPLITYVNASEDMIIVELPFPNAVTGKEFTVVGKARGMWYFEASFPVVVLDADGKTLATGIATAEGDWMTTEFVPFKAPIKIPSTYIGKATLLLKRDNASGLPEHDASMSFPFTIEY